MLKLGVLVSGGGTNLQAIIDHLEKKAVKNAEIAVVISNKKEAYALERAARHRLTACCIAPGAFNSREEYHDKLLAACREHEVDVIVLAGFLLVLPESIIKEYKNRIINVHPSLIPAFCGKGFYGLKVHEEALKRGVKVTGATVHFVDEGTDTGPIILQKAVPVEWNDTQETLQRKVMMEAEWLLLPQAIDLLAEDRVEVIDGKVRILEQ